MLRLPVAGVAVLAVISVSRPTTARAEPAGVINGTVIFEGEVPDQPAVRRDTDPYCQKLAPPPGDIVVTHGKLKDVLVRIKNGTWPARASAAVSPTPRAPALIDQKGCVYTPRVVGLVAGQALTVRNSDGTFHNVHGTIAGKPAWNKPAAPGDPPLTLDGSVHAGDVIDVVCDIHPWMHAYAVVQDHPVFAVTGEDGAFELRGLAPGVYTLEAWHPTLGTRTLRVTVGRGAKAAVSARLSFKRSEIP